MNTVRFHLEHCYGITLLDETLDFSSHSAIAIYAPNGMMKSSFAQTLDDIARGKNPCDRVYEDLKTICHVLDENGATISPEDILVFGPYDQGLDPTKRISNLLLSKKLKEEYDKLIGVIDDAKDVLLEAIKKQAQTKLRPEVIEAQISSDLMRVSNEFLPALGRLRNEIQKQDATPYADLKYDIIFDPKVLEFITSQTVKDSIENYVIRYNELLEASQFFSRKALNYYGAEQIAKSLTEHGFFRGKHTVRLNARNGEPRTIENEDQLAEIIAEEKTGILIDPKLTKEFNAFADKAEKNAQFRNLVAYLQDNPTWLAELQNPDKFRTEVWKSYLKTHASLYFSLLDKYNEAENRLRGLRASAASEKTLWESVVRLFNERFIVPFSLTAKNKTDACLGEHSHVECLIKFTDGPREVEIERDQLLKVLSMGQRKAFYILNILFEVYSRQQDGRETLIVLDDIADSFDYQNKYAIIQYLQDLNQDSKLFKQIIMTHNFDFFRTLVWRGVVRRENCFMASKHKNGTIKLEPAQGIRDAFKKMFKKDFVTEPKCAIACIPFLRNLRELQVNDDFSDPTYLSLTALLHWKPGVSEKILRSDLDAAYAEVFPKDKIATQNSHKPMVDVIQEEAEDCLEAPEGVNFHNKLILSIAIRLLSDRFMIAKIADDNFTRGITGRQTNKLFEEFKRRLPNDSAVAVMAKVILMTPENIHLNSFMYEPIIDMNDSHLRDLYRQVKHLKWD